MYRPKGRVMLATTTQPREEEKVDVDFTRGKGSSRDKPVSVATSARGKAGKGKGKGVDADGKGKKGKGSKGGEEPKGVTSRKDDTGPAGSSSKVVIRLLPPSITEDQLWQSIPEGVKGSIVWRYFVAGSQPKRPTISVPAVNSRCYLEFETKQQAFDFVNSFHGHKFVDQTGETYRAVVCASPWGRCLAGRKGGRHNRDVKEASIDKCRYFKEFISSIVEETPAALPEATEVTCDPAKTPLVDYINDWYREKEKRREKERRRQREAAEEARKKKKKQETSKETEKVGEKKEEKKKKSSRGGGKNDEWWYDRNWYGYGGGYRGGRKSGW